MNKNQFKIYVDEDSIEFGQHLKKEHKLNIIIPKNYGKSISDSFQLKLAIDNKAFILSKNKNHFLNIPNVFDKIGDGGIIIWTAKNYTDICGFILDLCRIRSFELKGKIYVVNNEGIIVYSKEGKSELRLDRPCQLCEETSCSIREKERI